MKNNEVYGIIKFINRKEENNCQSEIQLYKDIEMKKLKLYNVMQLVWAVKGENLNIKMTEVGGFKIKHTM